LHLRSCEARLWKVEVCRPFVDEESGSTQHLDESLGWNEVCFKAFVKMLTGRIGNLSDVTG
jgi:ribonucleotide reductase beta subunit family protein with ferritin-like domain